MKATLFVLMVTLCALGFSALADETKRKEVSHRGGIVEFQFPPLKQ